MASLLIVTHLLSVLFQLGALVEAQWKRVRHNAIYSNAVTHSAIYSNTVRHNAIYNNTVRHNAIYNNAVRHSAIYSNAVASLLVQFSLV